MLKKNSYLIVVFIITVSYKLFGMEYQQFGLQEAILDNDIAQAEYYLNRGNRLNFAEVGNRNLMVTLNARGEGSAALRKLLIERCPGASKLLVLPYEPSFLLSLLHSELQGGVRLLNFGAGVIRQLVRGSDFEKAEPSLAPLISSSKEHNCLTLVNAFLAGENEFKQQCIFSADIKRFLKNKLLYVHAVFPWIIENLKSHLQRPFVLDHDKYRAPIRRVSFDSTGTHVITELEGILQIWNAENGDELRYCELPYDAAHMTNIPLLLRGNEKFELVLAGQARNLRMCGRLDFAERESHIEVVNENFPEDRYIITPAPINLMVDVDLDAVYDLSAAQMCRLPELKNRPGRDFFASFPEEPKGQPVRDKAGRFVATIEDDDSIRVVDATTCLSHCINAGSFVQDIKFSNTGSCLLIRAENCSIFYDLNKRVSLLTNREKPFQYLGDPDYVHIRMESLIHSDMSTNGEWGAFIQDGCVRLINLKRYFELIDWLKNQCTFEQALLAILLHEADYANSILKLRNEASVNLFGKCPHLLKHFESMPIEIQKILSSFMAKTHEETSVEAA